MAMAVIPRWPPALEVSKIQQEERQGTEGGGAGGAALPCGRGSARKDRRDSR
jgi:hypothetical protein